MSGGSAGIGRRGGNSAIDEAPAAGVAASWEYFKLRSNRAYLWGQTTPGSNVGLTSTILNTLTEGHDMLRAIPHFFPKAGTIGRIGWHNPVVYGGGGGALHFGIYNDAGGFPSTKLWGSVDFTSWLDPALSPPWRFDTANVAAEAMQLYWVVWEYNDALRVAGQRIQTWNATESPGFLGYFAMDAGIETGDSVGAGARVPGSASCHIGWRCPHAFGTLPTTFPTSGAEAIAMNNAVLEPTTLDGRVAAFSYKWTDAA